MSVDFAEWAEEARRPAKPRMVRPSLDLPAALVARVDRVARVQGLSRSALVAHILDRWLASWRPLHKGDKRMTSGELSYAPPRRKWWRRKPARCSWKCFECGDSATGFRTMDDTAASWRRHQRRVHGPQPIKPNPGKASERGFDWPQPAHQPPIDDIRERYERDVQLCEWVDTLDGLTEGQRRRMQAAFLLGGTRYAHLIDTFGDDE